MTVAIHEIKIEKRNLHFVSKKYKIPRETLRRYCLKFAGAEVTKAKLGHKTCLGAFEEDLVSYILEFEKMGFGLTPPKIREIALEFVKRNDMPHPFNFNK